MSLISWEYSSKSEGCQARYERMLESWADKMRLTRCKLLRQCIGEFFGTIILIIFGLGVIGQFNFGTQEVFFSVSFGWGMGVMFGLFVSGTMGCGLMNPSLTLSFAIAGKIPWKAVVPLSLSQIAGAYIGALVVYVMYTQNINLLEKKHLVSHSMKLTGGIFVVGPSDAGNYAGLIDQIISTAILAALCLAIGDKYNMKMPNYVSTFYVGLLVYALVGAFATNAGAAMNSARDFGPRLALLSVGYTDAFTYQNYYFWIAFLGPYIGAIIGAILYEFTIGIHLKGLAQKKDDECIGCEFDAA